MYLLSSPYLIRIVTFPGKSVPHPRHERNDAPYLDLHVPLPRIVDNLYVKDGVTSQKLLSS